ncbi:MAG TPA: hypothetical protein PLY87_00700 [Planctomycetaceae bacterium]|nr:hypothetical protein [Planctomycetaceae bacterium]
MIRSSVIVSTFTSIWLIGSMIFVSAPLRGQEPPSLGAIQSHDHAPIVVDSRPVIERLPVTVIEPTDLRVSKSGCVFVADKVARCVFRLDSDGDVSLPVEHVRDISRIQVDSDDNLFVLTTGIRESQIQQVIPGGKSVAYAIPAFAATSFVKLSDERFILASQNSHRVVSLEGGTVTELAQVYERVSDLALNRGGQTVALLVSGKIVHIGTGGDVTAYGFAPAGSSRLMLQPDGSMLALTTQIGGHAQLVFISREDSRPSQFTPFASVPDGTQAVGFDVLGNLCLANPDLRAVTKVTSHFRVPCPHCGRATDMIFRKDPKPAANSVTRSF